MHTIIYTFSGTGNSLAITHQLAGLLEGTVNIHSMSIKKNIDLPENADRIGFVFPVYFQSVPKVVKTFINRLRFDAHPYFFAIATCNGVPGHTLFTLKKLLKQRGQSLSAGFSLDMPGNSLIVVDYMNPIDVQQSRLAQVGGRLREIAEAIQAKRTGVIEGDDGFHSHLSGLINSTIVNHIYRTPRRFRVSPTCTNCGTCARVCPMSNIRCDKKAGPRWGADCASCLACFHWCPQAAIDLKQNLSTKGKRRYHHPEVTLKDMTPY